MFKLKTIDATSGRLLPSILIYAVPLILATLVQTLFHAVDLIVLRYTADSVAIASVGATGTITTLIVHTFIGLSGEPMSSLRASSVQRITRISMTQHPPPS